MRICRFVEEFLIEIVYRNVDAVAIGLVAENEYLGHYVAIQFFCQGGGDVSGAVSYDFDRHYNLLRHCGVERGNYAGSIQTAPLFWQIERVIGRNRDYLSGFILLIRFSTASR